MIGIIPSANKTYEVYGSILDNDPIEGKLYYDPKDERIYYYSLTDRRSCPKIGFFPIWNGKEFLISKFSNRKYLSDVIKTDINEMSSRINKDVANNILYKHMSSESNIKILEPKISIEDNMFTQCIKAVIIQKKITIVDLFNMARPKLNETIIENYYNTLNKIVFMRYDKWSIWINDILHLKYRIKVYKGNKKVLEYHYPEDTFDTGIVNYLDSINKKDDPFKKITKLLILMFNIDKSTLRKQCSDDYTVNNLMTTINSKKVLSSQLFSRFISMAEFNYVMELYEDDKMIFEFKE